MEADITVGSAVEFIVQNRQVKLIIKLSSLSGDT